MLAGKRHVALRQCSSQLKKIPREFEKELLQRQVISTLYKILPAIQRAPTDKQRLQVLWSVCESMLNSFDDQCWKSLPKSLVGDILVGLREIDGFESKKSLLLAKIRASVGGVPELEDKNVAFESVGDFRRWHDLKISPSKGKIELVHAVLVNSCLNASFNAIKAIFTDAQQLYTLNYTLISEMLTKKALIPQLSQSERVKYAQIIQWIAEFKVSGRERVYVLNNLISLRNIASFNDCVAIVSEFNRKLVSMNDNTFVIMIRKLNEKEAIKFLEYLNRNGLPWVKASIEFLRLNLSQRAQIAFSLYLAVPDKAKLLSNIIDSDHWILDSLFMAACTRSSSVVNNFVEEIGTANVTIGSSKLTSGILYLCRSGRVDTASNAFAKLRDFSQGDQNIQKDVFAVTEGFVNERKISFAFKFVQFVQGHNYPIGSRVHMQLLNGLISQGQLEKALNWFSENCKTSDIKLFNTLLQGFVDFDLDKKVEMLLGKMDEWKISKNDHTFAILIGWYLKNNNTISASSLLNNSSAGDLSFAKFIEYYISIGDWSKVKELWNSLPKAGIFDTSNSLVIKASVLSGNPFEIEKIAKGINPSLQPKTARTLILYYLRIGMVKEAEILLQGMSAVKGVPEKAYAITEFILHFCRIGDYDSAHHYLAQYNSLFTLHSRPYCVLMRSVPRNNLPISKVLEYWEQMKSLKVPLDAAAYTSIIAAHSDKNLQHNALEFYKQFIATKQTPTLEMYACVMVLHGKLKNISSLERLYHVATGQTKRLTKNYSMMLLNALITSYSYGGEWQKALTVWNRLRAQFNQDCRAVKRTSAVSPALPDIFMQTSSSMTLQMFGVDTVTICVILDALGKAQRLDEVRSVWDDVRSNNMPLVLNNITSFVEALLRCEQANEALDLVLKLQDKFGIEPDRKLLLNTATLMPVSRYAETVEILKKRYPDVQPVYPPYIRHRQGPKKEALVAAKPGLTAEQLDKQLRFKNGVWLLPPLKFNSQK